MTHCDTQKLMILSNYFSEHGPKQQKSSNYNIFLKSSAYFSWNIIHLCYLDSAEMGRKHGKDQGNFTLADKNMT